MLNDVSLSLTYLRVYSQFLACYYYQFDGLIAAGIHGYS